MGKMTDGQKRARQRLNRLLDRPWYLPRPSSAEIVGAALAKLHADITAIVSARSALEEHNGKPRDTP